MLDCSFRNKLIHLNANICQKYFCNSNYLFGFPLSPTMVIEVMMIIVREYFNGHSINPNS